MPEKDELGMWPDLSYEQYDALAGLRKTNLWKLIGGTPAHYRYALAHPETTAAMDLGRAVHDAVLCPDVFTSHYVGPPYPPDCPDVEAGKWDRRRKVHREAWLRFEAENAGKVVMKQDDWDNCLSMRAAVMQHPSAKLLVETAQAEVSIQWRDQQTDLLCKARLDIWHEAGGVLADLKTCSRGDVSGFGRDSYKYGYPFQLAFYSDGIAAITGRTPGVVNLIAVESAPPYLVAVYDVGQDIIELGRSQYRQSLATVVECERTGVWPGYSDYPLDLVLPSYAGMELASTDVF